MTDTKTAVRQRILDLCAQRGISVNRLATRSGVTQSTLNNIVSGRNNSATVATIKKLCDGLDITLREFFDVAAFDDLEQEVK
ncbi:MAG: helix-turn-helix transcriptional regulator [Oscillospiraceae bacterium]|nr:helix-turn-helix transcriptional regulator [Oscillospiraceae bacterium]